MSDEYVPPSEWDDATIAEKLDTAIKAMLEPASKEEMPQYRATIRIMRKAAIRLRALASSPRQPEEWKLVPIEPTMLMYDAWVDAKKNGHDDGVFGTWIAAYKAMCAAAPALGEPQP